MQSDISSYDTLLTQIEQALSQGRQTAAIAVNHALVTTYWNIGKHIVEYEQKGNEKAVYGFSSNFQFWEHHPQN